jgi:HSP20 family protein
VRIAEAGWVWSYLRHVLVAAEAPDTGGLGRPDAQSTEAGPLWCPPADVYSADGSWWVTVALPGVSRASLEVEVRGGVLRVRGTRPAPWRQSAAALQRLEIPYGRFERTIALPDPGAVLTGAELVDGCLHIELCGRS